MHNKQECMYSLVYYHFTLPFCLRLSKTLVPFMHQSWILVPLMEVSWILVHFVVFKSFFPLMDISYILVPSLEISWDSGPFYMQT